MSIIIIIFVLQSIILFSIERHINFPYKDAFLWFKAVIKLKFYGNLDFDVIKGMPGGFIFFTAGPLLFINNYIIMYYYFKFIPMFLMYINVLVIYEISNKVFKDLEYVFFTLIIFLCFRYLFFRYLGAGPSILATNLGFIFLLSFESKDDFFNNFKRGTLLGGMALCHLLYCIFYLGVFLLYEIWKFMNIIIIKRKQEVIKYKFKSLLIPLLKKYSVIIGLIIFFSFFYVLSLTIEGIDIIDTYFYTIEKHSPMTISNTISDITQSKLLLLKTFSEDPNNFKNFIGFLLYLLKYFLNKTLTIATLILFCAYFLNFNKNNEFSNETKKIIAFTQFSFLAIFLFFVLIGILYGLEILLIQGLVTSLLRYESRLLELFQGFWAIIFSLVIKEFIAMLNKLIYNYRKSKTVKLKTNKNINYNFNKQLQSLTLIILLGLGTYFYIEHLYAHNEWFYHSYYDDEDLGNIIVNAGDYFNEKYGHEAEDINLLLFDNVDPKNIFWLLEVFEYIEINDSYSYDDISDDELSDVIEYNDADYAISPKYELKSSALKEIESEHDVIYENERYIFYKI